MVERYRPQTRYRPRKAAFVLEKGTRVGLIGSTSGLTGTVRIVGPEVSEVLWDSARSVHDTDYTPNTWLKPEEE